MKSECNDELVYLRLCSMLPHRDRQAPRDRGELVVGVNLTGKFLGRSTCRKGYISATRVGGHCHGDHCDYDQQLDHKVHNLLQTNQGEEFS